MEVTGTVLRLADGSAEVYRRDRHLTRLIGLWPHEIADRSRQGTLAVLAHLRTAIRAERRKGRAGHWTYDLNRHIGLIGAYKAESERLRRMEKAGPP